MSVAAGLTIDRKTAEGHLRLLEDLFLAVRIPAWGRNSAPAQVQAEGPVVDGGLRKQVSWMIEPMTIGHWRTHDGDEVDIVMEFDDDYVLAFEVKAAERVREADLKGLAGCATRSAIGSSP